MQPLLLKPKDCANVLNVGVTKFYEEVVTDKTFPAPIMIGKTKYYRYEDVQNWVSGLKASA